jgi:hypothetical protein
MSEDANAPSTPVVRICLASDPDLPARLARRLADELPELLSRRLASSVEWRTRFVVAPLQGDEQIHVTRLAEHVGELMPDDEWDVAVFLTDLPRRAGVRPVAAEIDPDHRLALLSIPALGFFWLYPRVREAVVRLIGELIVSDYRPDPAAKRSRLRSVSARPLRRAPEPLAGSVRLLGTPWLGPVLMVAGMVRANQPWRLFLGLSRSLVGVFATAAFGLIDNTTWRLGVALGPARQVVVMILSIAVLAAWLIIDHELWERPADRRRRGQAALYNLTTAITVTLGVLCLYVLLLIGVLIAERLVLDASVLAQTISRWPRWSDHVSIVWFITSGSIVGGALGSSLEDDSVVRRAAYGARQRQRHSDRKPREQ